jgi:hypothetical protein
LVDPSEAWSGRTNSDSGDHSNAAEIRPLTCTRTALSLPFYLPTPNSEKREDGESATSVEDCSFGGWMDASAGRVRWSLCWLYSCSATFLLLRSWRGCCCLLFTVFSVHARPGWVHVQEKVCIPILSRQPAFWTRPVLVLSSKSGSVLKRTSSGVSSFVLISPDNEWFYSSSGV